MARLSAKSLSGLRGIRDYLAARRIEVKDDLNTGKGLTAMIARLDGVLRTHSTAPKVETEIAMLDVSGLDSVLAGCDGAFRITAVPAVWNLGYAKVTPPTVHTSSPNCSCETCEPAETEEASP